MKAFLLILSFLIPGVIGLFLGGFGVAFIAGLLGVLIFLAALIIDKLNTVLYLSYKSAEDNDDSDEEE